MAARALEWLRWSAGVLGTGKSFRDNPILGSAPLNRAGLHVARLTAAHAAMAARRAQLAPLVPRAERRAFQRDGFLVLPDFLDASAHRAVRDEARAYRGTVRECTQGDTLTHRVLLDRRQRAAMPAIDALVRDRRLRRLLAWTSGSTWPPLFYIQQVLNAVRRARPDPQKHLHADTFHPTIKAWYFLDDVGPDGGPFRYVPGSQRLTPARLRWEHARSLDARTRDSYSARGSLRLSESDRLELGLPPARSFAVAGNTLVIADTHGFHARGDTSAPCARLEVWAYARPNPFRPFAILPVPFASDLQEGVMRWWYQRNDTRASARGGQASWHPVERTSLDGMPDALRRASADR